MELQENNYNELYARLKSYLAKRISVSNDLEDMTQEILLKVSLGTKSLSSSEKLIPWFYSIARNTLVDYHRKKKVPTSPLEDDILLGPDEIEDHEPVSFDLD